QSLQEIRRVLRPGGTFLIYQLPQEHAWQEAVYRGLRRGVPHARRFTMEEIHRLLMAKGYRILRCRRSSLFPKNLTGLPSWVRKGYSHLGRFLISADRLACSLPLVNRVAGVLEIHAQRR
ncbi:MAG: hypothetical protein ACYTHM_14740, partial [Planctomycetota bacterium]